MAWWWRGVMSSLVGPLALSVFAGCRPGSEPTQAPVVPSQAPDGEPTAQRVELHFAGGSIALHQDGELKVRNEWNDEESLMELLGAVNALAVQPTRPKVVVYVEPETQVDWTLKVLGRVLEEPIEVRIEAVGTSGEPVSFGLVESHRLGEPTGCSRVHVTALGDRYRVELDDGSNRWRVGLAETADELPKVLAAIGSPVCSEAVLQGRWKATWAPLHRIGPALQAAGIDAIATEHARPPDTQVYAAFEPSPSHARLRLEHRQLFCCYVEGHYEGLTIAPATGPSVFEGAVPEWIPTSFTLELPAQTYDVDVQGQMGMGGAMEGCGTRVTLEPGKEVQLFHNMWPRGCTVSKEEGRSEHEWRNRPITLVRDPGKGTRRAWRLEVWQPDGRHPLFAYVAPATMRELTLPLIPGELEFRLAEVTAVTGSPTWWCQLWPGGDRCDGVEVETANACRVVVAGEDSFRITYRPGKGCRSTKLKK